MNATTMIGIAYAAIFVLICFKHPRVALLLTFARAPFQNDLSGNLPIRFSMAEVNLVLSLFIYIRIIATGGQRLRMGPLTIPVLVYFVIALLSSLRDWRASTTISLVQSSEYLIFATLVFSALPRSVEDYRWALNGLILVGVFIGGVLLISSSTAALDLNKNGAGGSMSCCLLVAMELWLSSSDPRRRRLLLGAMAVIAIGLIFTLSRGSWLGTIAGMIVLFCIKREFRSLARTLAVLTPLIAIAWIQLPDESQDFAVGFETSRLNISARLESIEIANKYWQTEPVLGVGVGLRKEFDATNIVMTMLAETGILGLGAFVLIHIVFYRMIWTTLPRVPPGSLSSSILGIAAALITSKLTHGMVDHYWSRGSLLLAWAAAGMATYVYYSVIDAPMARPMPGPRRLRMIGRPMYRGRPLRPLEAEIPDPPIRRRRPIRGPIAGRRLSGPEAEDR